MIKEIEFVVPVSEANNMGYYRTVVANVCDIDISAINDINVEKRSIDARRGKVTYNIKAMVYTDDSHYVSEKKQYDYKYVQNAIPVIVVGAGPAGLFASLRLLERGYKPIILERGRDVHERKKDIANLYRTNMVNEDSNYCFGEGGAGTFSDGKLYTRSTKRGDVADVLNVFVEHGADKDIIIDAHPHIGTDKLPTIIENIRKTIVGHGGEYHFNTRVVDFIINGYEIKGVVDQNSTEYNGAAVILSTGHSARDIYELLDRKKIEIEAKGFAMGVRVEHPQALIDNIQYHGNRQRYKLPAASYNVVTQVEGRGVFSFCMCPGGMIIPANTADGELVVNGMSNSLRNSPFANSGMVVSIEPGDLQLYNKYGELSCLCFQQEIERQMYNKESRTLVAPAQRMIDFVAGRVSQSLVKSSYIPGVISAPMHELLPNFIVRRMQQAFTIFDKKMHGYYTNESLLIGLESRTSSPVRIIRDRETLEHVSIKRLFPCGEGAGYSGGIVSSAIDGINVADKI